MDKPNEVIKFIEFLKADRQRFATEPRDLANSNTLYSSSYCFFHGQSIANKTLIFELDELYAKFLKQGGAK